MVRKRILTLLTAVTIGCAALAGCGASADSSAAAASAAESKTEENESAESEATAESESAAAETVSTGKHINAALYWFGTSLDPATEYDGWTTCRAGITETLVTVDENYELKPLLADSWEQVDDSTWVMHIREGVTFHDGTPVDGEAVKASFERAMEVQERAKTAAKIDTIEADGQNVTFTTTEPFGAFLANISEPLYSVVKVGDDQDYANAPIATGPFRATGFEVNTTIELEKYADYWNGASDVDTITVTCISDDSTRGLALQSQEQDIVQRVSSTDVDMFIADPAYQVFDTTGARVRILLLNEANEDLADDNVREALAYAIDYDSLVTVLGSGVTAAGAPYPSSAPYAYDELDKQSYNSDQAEALLADAGYEDTDGDGIVEKDGNALTLVLVYSMSDYTTMLEAVQAMARACGIDIQLKLVDDITEPENSGDFDILCTNWQSLSTGDPQWFLDNLYKSDGPANYTSYQSEELDSLINDLSNAFDVEERTKITIEAEKVLLQDNPSIWLVGEKNFVVANDKVSNVTAYPIDYYFLDNKITISE